MRPLCLCVLVLYATALSAAEPTPLERDDPRLAKRVTLRLKRTPLSDVVAELRRQTGVTLATAAPVADEPAIVYLADLPAAEVMRHLAEHFDYRWRRTGSAPRYRYELYQPRESAQREEALREQDQKLSLAALHERASSRRPEEDPTVAQHMRAGRALLQMLDESGPAAWKPLAAGERLRLTRPRQPGDQLLEDAAATVFLDSLKHHFGPDTPLDVQTRFRREYQEAVAQATALRVEVWLDFEGPASLAIASRLTGRISLVPSAEAAQKTPRRARVGLLGVYGHPPPDPVNPAEAADRWGADPVFGIRRAFGVDPTRLLSPVRARIRSNRLRLPDFLPVLAETYGIQLVADAYESQVAPPAPPARPVETALYDALNRYVRPRAEWEDAGGVCRVRSRTWYHDRLADLPDRVTRSLVERLRQRHRMELEDAAQLMLALRNEQLVRLPSILKADGVHIHTLVGSLFDGPRSRSTREILRCYAGLPARQRRDLQSDNGLRVGDLQTEACGWLARALEQFDRDAAAPTRLSLQPDARLSLRVDELLREVDLGAGEQGTFRLRYRRGPQAGELASGGPLEPARDPPGFLRGGQIQHRVLFRYVQGPESEAGFTVDLPCVYLEPELETQPEGGVRGTPPRPR